MVERYVRDVEVASSNLVTPILMMKGTGILDLQEFQFFLYSYGIDFSNDTKEGEEN